jgi:hypothetical protein
VDWQERNATGILLFIWRMLIAKQIFVCQWLLPNQHLFAKHDTHLPKHDTFLSATLITAANLRHRRHASPPPLPFITAHHGLNHPHLECHIGW